MTVEDPNETVMHDEQEYQSMIDAIVDAILVKIG